MASVASPRSRPSGGGASGGASEWRIPPPSVDRFRGGFHSPGMAHTLPELPWAKDALAPVISQETIEYHYGKHHAAYVNKLNELIAGKPLAELPLEEVVKKTWKQTNEVPVFNNAAQVWTTPSTGTACRPRVAASRP